MTYQITGLNPQPFARLYGLSEYKLRQRGVVRMVVTDRPGFPCRVTLDDAEIGERILLLNHVSHDVTNPYRASHAIFVTEGAEQARNYVDEVPPALATRMLSLRGFGRDGMMADAALTEAGEADSGIRRLFADPKIAYIHAHNVIRGCFAAKVERFE